MPRTNNLTHNVRPRYTPGSPACVQGGLASRVAREEREAIRGALEGAWGEVAKAHAEKVGLANIVTCKLERRGGWDVHDLLTDERYRRPFKWKKGEAVEYWDDTEGWVPAIVHEKTDGIMVMLHEATTPWTRPPFEVRRDALRLVAGQWRPGDAEELEPKPLA